jgi:hypothetical protein
VKDASAGAAVRRATSTLIWAPNGPSADFLSVTTIDLPFGGPVKESPGLPPLVWRLTWQTYD